MAEVTPGDLIQLRIVAMLTAGAATYLAVNGRTPTVRDRWPKARFSQRRLPLIVVADPMLESDGPWGGDHERKVYNVPIGIIDGVGPGEDAIREGERRLKLLGEKLVQFMKGPDAPANWNLASIYVFPRMCGFEVDSTIRAAGNNLGMLPLTVTVPTTIAAGAVLEV